MRRSGFTMVELIFVIVIIGILAAVALPKFNGVRDKAKTNTEVSAMNSLDSGAINAQVEFRLQDYNDRNIDWNDRTITNKVTDYQSINADYDVLKKIMKKADKFKIIGYAEVNSDTNATNDLLLITGEASNKANGILQSADGDIVGSPDKNDFWVFNPNNFDVNITVSTGTLHNKDTIINAESIALVDVNDSITAVTDITFTDTEDSTQTGAGVVVQ